MTDYTYLSPLSGNIFINLKSKCDEKINLNRKVNEDIFRKKFETQVSYFFMCNLNLQ